MDLAVWLRSLGLEQYEAAFRENDIDETILPSLTHENLKELGVASLGHRVKLLRSAQRHERQDAICRNSDPIERPRRITISAYQKWLFTLVQLLNRNSFQPRRLGPPEAAGTRKAPPPIRKEGKEPRCCSSATCDFS
jgi:hypothetical protein